MPYLQTILDAETKAKEIVEHAEQEATRRLAEATAATTHQEAVARAELEEERAVRLEAQARDLAKERTVALEHAEAEAQRIHALVRPKQEAAIARIQDLMVG